MRSLRHENVHSGENLLPEVERAPIGEPKPAGRGGRALCSRAGPGVDRVVGGLGVQDHRGLRANSGQGSTARPNP